MSIYLNQQAYKCPCQKCKDRKLNCHSKCEKYLEWVKANEKIRNKERIEKVSDSTHNDGWGYIPRKKKHNVR